MDELKRLLREAHEEVPVNPQATLAPLLSDAQFMLGRMKQRIEEYERARKALRDIVSAMEGIEDSDTHAAEEAIAVLHRRIGSREAFARADTHEMGQLAEAIRSAANGCEHRLRKYKDQMLNIHEAFDGIRGGRPWLTTAATATSLRAALEREHQAWLPGDPHRGQLLEWLVTSSAHIPEARGPGGEPFVQFEDGGCMLMSQVRWHPEIRNFHPASARPGSTERT